MTDGPEELRLSPCTIKACPQSYLFKRNMVLLSYENCIVGYMRGCTKQILNILI